MYKRQPFWGPAEGVALRAGVYNWSYVNNDGSRGIHNTARAVELLQLTYRQLSGRPAPGMTWQEGTASKRRFQDRFAAERSPLADFNWALVAIPLALAGPLGALGLGAVLARRDVKERKIIE